MHYVGDRVVIILWNFLSFCPILSLQIVYAHQVEDVFHFCPPIPSHVMDYVWPLLFPKIIKSTCIYLHYSFVTGFSNGAILPAPFSGYPLFSPNDKEYMENILGLILNHIKDLIIPDKLSPVEYEVPPPSQVHSVNTL